jgi:dTDP-4-dehydrorhamnose reductase
VTAILIIGKNGQIGSALSDPLRPLGKVTSLGRADLDLTQPDAIRTAIRHYKPAIIVNAAAYTAVDRAESEPDLAMQINGVAAGIIAEEAHRAGALMIHYSTDYVFDGTKSGAYVESDTPNPLNTYGRTKLAGESAIRATGARHYTLRTSWVYSVRGTNFLTTIIRLSREREELRIVNDQIGAPTPARMIAEITAQLIVRVTTQSGRSDPEYGTYHLTASGAVTWFGFAQAILKRASAPGTASPRLVPVTTREYPLPARRPANSQLDCTRLERALGISMPPWQQGLEQCLQQEWT